MAVSEQTGRSPAQTGGDCGPEGCCPGRSNPLLFTVIVSDRLQDEEGASVAPAIENVAPLTELDVPLLPGNQAAGRILQQPLVLFESQLAAVGEVPVDLHLGERGGRLLV